jgi:hypothetical protein
MEKQNLIPSGWYECSIDRVEIKSTKAKNGKYILLGFLLNEFRFRRRTIFTNILIEHASAKAEQIGRNTLGQIMQCLHLEKIKEATDFLGKKIIIKVEIKKTIDYGEINEVKGYRPIPIIEQEKKDNSAFENPWKE